MAPSSNKSDSVYKRVVDHLFSGNVHPGDKLVEREYASILGASRIPVREALTRLVARGVLVRDPRNHSVRMRQYGADEVADLLEYREAIEVACVRVACEKYHQSDLIRLDLICDQMEALVGKLVSPDWVDLDRMFHQTIVAASGNRRFVEDFVLLVAESHYVFYLHPARQSRRHQEVTALTDHLNNVISDHRHIAEAIRSGSVEGAVQRLRRHLRTASERLSRDILKAEFEVG